MLVFFVLLVGDQFAVDHFAVNHVVLAVEIDSGFNALVALLTHHGLPHEKLSRPQLSVGPLPPLQLTRGSQPHGDFFAASATLHVDPYGVPALAPHVSCFAL